MRLILMLVVLFFIGGCSLDPSYEVYPQERLNYIKTKRVTPRTVQTYIPIDRYYGYPTLDWICYDKNGSAYYLYKRKPERLSEGMKPFTLYGLSKKFVKSFNTVSEISTYVKLYCEKLKSTNKSHLYHTFLPEVNLYVKVKKENFIIGDGITDLIFEVTDDYLNDSDARKIIGEVLIKTELESFLKSLNAQKGDLPLYNMIDRKKMRWYSEQGKNRYIEGKGSILLPFKDDEYLDYISIEGYFKDGWPDGDVNIEVYAQKCLKRGILICQKKVAHRYRETISSRHMKIMIIEGIKTVRSSIERKVDEYLSTHRQSSSSNGTVSVDSCEYEDWKKNITCHVLYNGSYDGLIWYSQHDDPNNFLINMGGLKHGRITSGHYNSYFKTLKTRCGKINVSGIQDALLKTANCAYNNSY